PACPTCNDGIKNGKETGIDCGGPDCPACPTCNDGIKNGKETGIDCGGPDCPACPTCNDGIQNGEETGIDCGGPDCVPCKEDNERDEVNLGGYYFENGWDNWTSGGVNSLRLKTAYSPEARYSIQLKGNSNEASSMISPTYDLTDFDTVIVEFKLRAFNFKAQDALIFQYFNGNTWITVQQYIFKQDFNNSLIYTKRIRLSGHLNVQSQFRFQANTGDLSGAIYIDAIEVTGIIHKSNASCEDGIKNGLETGIDCGGPECPPCETYHNQEILIGGYYFENGWDTWISGGAFSKRLKTAYSPEGSYSIQLKAQDPESSTMFSPNLDCSQFDTIKIEFKFRTINLNPGDSFTFRYFNGKNWINIEQYEFKKDFSNSLIYTRSFKIYGLLSDSSQFAIQAHIQDNKGQIYMDAITIHGKVNSPASCDDGIQNGLETGIDCGGPHCPACEQAPVVNIGGYYFENGWDAWTGAEQGSIRYFGEPSPEGDYCIQLNHPSGNPTFMTSPLYNLNTYKNLEIHFSFIAKNMSDGERFILQYHNGGRWINLTSFIKGLDFENEKTYQAVYQLGGFLSSAASFRIYKEAAHPNSSLYIDAIILNGYAKEVFYQTPLEIREITKEESQATAPSVSIHPNPALDHITISATEPLKRVSIFQTSGQVVLQTNMEDQKEIDIAHLNSGMYIIQIETATNIFTRKLIKR
ncbi:MAG: T9SS type A sorting domain-containing protein, partial [Chitinophagales bacterium]|nr:T9SS type A sorting domain-containing protein [Chitinophagales bacterium]